MSQPFRDEYAAALDRAERLAEENEDLRREVRRVRVGPEAPPSPGKPAPPPDSLKERTLERLDELATQIDAHQKEEEPAAVPPAPTAPTAPAPPSLTPERSDALAPLVTEAHDVMLLRAEARDAVARAIAAEAEVKRLTAELRIGRSFSILAMGALAILLMLAVAVALAR